MRADVELTPWAATIIKRSLLDAAFIESVREQIPQLLGPLAADFADLLNVTGRMDGEPLERSYELNIKVCFRHRRSGETGETYTSVRAMLE